MADGESAGDRMAALLAKHKQEKKELQGKTLSMKKSISKTDKKKKKALNDEIEQMEKDMANRQQAELEALKSTLILGNGEACEGADEATSADQTADDLEALSVREPREPRVTKAQRRRDKKAEEARQRDARIAEQEVLNREGPRVKEMQAIKERLNLRQLMVHEIPSDGDCLYAAVGHQMSLQSATSSVSALRRQTASELLRNAAEYRPFLTDSKTGDMYTDDGYAEYCRQVADTPAWGGMTEVAALSAALRRPIEVVQAEGAPVVLGSQHQATSQATAAPPATLVITYHRHMYGLGEHYNSTRARSEEEDHSEHGED